jgi:methionine-R-sulfoxide reductase
MNTIKKYLIFLIFAQLSGINMGYSQAQTINDSTMSKSNEEWKQLLTPMQFHILREKGTERPFTGELENHFEKGKYHCAACDNYLFDSDQKYHSGCGWPSFSDVTKKNITLKEDNSLGMHRTEVLCAKCGGHLGHVFKDGPPPTHLRYCINSASLKFIPENTK